MVLLRNLLLAACLTCCVPFAVRAEGPNLPIPIRIEKLESARVGETREFWVSLPDGYQEGDEKYPVVYLMDGEFNFNSGGIGALRHAARMGEMPEFIIVGIRNTDRLKDAFPEEITFPDSTRGGARAGQYLEFIQQELIPQVEKTYRTETFRVLYGTSNTGLTTVYALLHAPALADAYIAASATLSIPSFRRERDQLVRDFKGGRRRLVLVMGEHDFPTIISQNGALKESIAQSAPAGLSCRLAVIPNGEHVPANSLVEGMRDLFEGWKITERLSESSYPGSRAQVDDRGARFGVPGRLPEDALKDLGETLLGEKKYGKAIEVLQYRVRSYPRSPAAQVGLGDANRLDGRSERARDCYRQALALDPGHAAATAKLQELGR